MNSQKLQAVWARCKKGSTQGERDTAYRVLASMLNKNMSLRGPFAGAFEMARRPETVAHLAVDMFIDTGADGYDHGLDFEMVKSECRVFFASLPAAFLTDVRAALKAMKKPVKGVYTADHLKAINGVEYLVSNTLR